MPASPIDKSSTVANPVIDNSWGALAKQWRMLLFGVLMTFWSAPGQTFFIALFSDAIRSKLSLSFGEFGAIYSAATLLSAVVILWSGSLIDRIAIPRFALFTALALGLAMLLLSISDSVLMLFWVLFLLRQLGQGLMMLTAGTTMLRYLPQFAGRASALSSMGYVLAEAILPIVIVSAFALYSWQGTLQLSAVVMLACMLIAIPLLLRDYRARDARYRKDLELQNLDKQHLDKQGLDAAQRDDQASPATKNGDWTRAQVLRDPHFYLLMPALLSQSLLFTGFIFHQDFIVTSQGWQIHWWASLFSLYAMIALGSKLLAGIAIDRWGPLALLPFSPLPLAAGLAALAISDASIAALMFFIGLAITTGVQTTLTGAIWLFLYGSRHLGSIKSLSSSMITLGTAATPLLFGILIDNGVSLAALCWGSIVFIFIAVFLVGISTAMKRAAR